MNEGGISVTLTVVLFTTSYDPLIFHVFGFCGSLVKVPVNSLNHGDSVFIFFSVRTAKHASITSLGLRLSTFVANPTAIPEDPFKITVGTIGKKYSGSISTPSSTLEVNNSKSW